MNASIDRDRLSSILASSTGDGPVASLYFRTDGARSEREIALKDLVRRGASAIETEAGDRARRDQALASLERAREAAQRAIGAGPGTVATFAWPDRVESFLVPARLTEGAVIGRSPFVAPLSSLVEQSEHFGIVIADRGRARILDALLGSIEQLEHLEDASEQNVSWAGWSGRDQLKVNHHRDALLHAHIQHVADRLFAHHKRRGFTRLVLAGTPDVLAKLERSLHASLRGLVVAREGWAQEIDQEQIRAKIASLEARIDAEKERALLSSIRDRAHGGDMLATTGPDATLRALREGRVATLALAASPELTGRECTACGHLFPGRGDVGCVLCRASTRAIPDLAARAAELAALTRAKVVTIASAREELEALGGMAATLRFRWT